jgi:hypothetical protein
MDQEHLPLTLSVTEADGNRTRLVALAELGSERLRGGWSKGPLTGALVPQLVPLEVGN